jgi:hypothetical protein
MAAYSRDFLISAFLSRYVTLPEAQFASLCEMAYQFYAETGRDKFRVYCSLDAAALKLYRNQL